jgi:5-methylcytosine-specific restriction endonuclease McrA
MPCSEKRARLLLQRGRAVIHRQVPLVIRLKDRRREQGTLQQVVLKLDPGSQTTGIALAREGPTEDGLYHHAQFLAELSHRGEVVHRQMQQRAAYRRRRRSANLRHRAPRFDNRKRAEGWLPPSIESRLATTMSQVKRLLRWCPVSRIIVERVRFDTQQLENPEIQGIEYQQGTLFGMEVRDYLLAKWNHQCAYCDAREVPLEIDHLVARARGGSDRVSNLVIACHTCNQAKADQSVREFLIDRPERFARILAQTKQPLKDAATMNATRYALVERLHALGLPIETSSGGRTKWNRSRFGIAKSHALDALCVGEMAGVTVGKLRILQIRAMGRGSYQRTNVDASGFLRGFLPRQKQMRGFQTGDLVRAVVPGHLKTAGVHVGRVAVRMSGSFRVGTVDGINARYCRVVQRQDGYMYMLR